MTAIRSATLGDLETVLDWAAAEGWNPGFDDAAAFHAADPGGFFVAEDGTGLTGAISVVRHGPSMAFLGLFIVRPDRRGTGIGRALWDRGIALAGDRTVGLDGVAAQEANYARSGFVRTGASIRFEGRIAPEPGEARPAGPHDLPRLDVMDRAATGYDRAAFLTAWTAPSDARLTLIARDGFATVRRCRTGCKIGPVVAPNADAGLALCRAAAAAMPAKTHIVDAAPGSAFGATLAAAGLTETFRTARMYRGPAPSGDGTQQAIATMELG